MNPDEFRRIGAVEQRLAISEERDRVADERLNRMEAKMDLLLKAMNMGEGAWKATMKIGAVIVILSGFVAWLWNILSPLLTGKH